MVMEKSGEVKSAEIWLFATLKYQYHEAVVSYMHAQIICTELSTHQYPHIASLQQQKKQKLAELKAEAAAIDSKIASVIESAKDHY